MTLKTTRIVQVAYDRSTDTMYWFRKPLCGEGNPVCVTVENASTMEYRMRSLHAPVTYLADTTNDAERFALEGLAMFKTQTYKHVQLDVKQSVGDK